MLNADGVKGRRLTPRGVLYQCYLGAARLGLLAGKRHTVSCTHHCMPLLISCPLQSGADEQLSIHAIVRIKAQLCSGPAVPRGCWL